jgi:alanyl-tRNA synthetase
MTGNEIRRTFLKFFEGNGHRIVRSSSLVPMNDPTLLFTNAGMNQFKDVFLGAEQRDYRRATTCQKCVRAGGKHNDLENVGFTNRHHTFFEMLGNFSFGDYFKKEAIAFAWDLITSPKWFGIPVEKLYVTIFKGEDGIERDAEAYEHWVAQGVKKERIYEFGSKENFWAMGDTGPCGPCSEIHYDMGPVASDKGHADCEFGCECGRYVEIWNLVFMQFNRDGAGALVPLPRPSVDTGAGLERIAAVLQGKISNFDTDLFQPLMAEAAKLAGLPSDKPEIQASLRIIADHSRAATFLISDGVVPSNDGRGYVLRKIIRRALRHAKLIEGKFPFLSKMAAAVRAEMREAYPELEETAARVSKVLDEEELRFARTVDVGLAKLDEFIAEFKAAQGTSDAPDALSGLKIFQLYSTHGLPPDFIKDVAHDQRVPVAWGEFDDAMQKDRELAKASWKGGSKETANPIYGKLAETFKTGTDFYYGTTSRDCHIEAIVTKNGQVSELKAGEAGEIVLDRTAIYSESGGQQADTGSFYDNDLSLEVAQVKGAYYPVTGLVAHRVVAKEDLRVGDRVATVADAQRRARNKRHHTATHLLHAALRNSLGTHVRQAGSLVAPNHLRFDFSHFAAVDPGELKEIEEAVNEEILRNTRITTDLMNIDDALASGAIAFFGDKYPSENVRVVTVLDANAPRGFYSKELCGGTHVGCSGEIGMFKILSEQSVAAGVRRIEAISGDIALVEYQRALSTLRSLAIRLNAGEDELLAAVDRREQEIKALEKQLKEFRRKAAGSLVDDLLGKVRPVKDIHLVAARVTGVDRDGMRQLVDTLRQRLGSGAVVLLSGDDGKVSLIAGVTKDLIPRLHSGKIVQELARLVGGSGGGRPDLAEAGGKDTSAIETALEQLIPLLERML